MLYLVSERGWLAGKWEGYGAEPATCFECVPKTLSEVACTRVRAVWSGFHVRTTPLTPCPSSHAFADLFGCFWSPTAAVPDAVLPPLARATSCSTQALRWLPPRSNGRLVSAYEIQRRRIRGGGHPDDSDSEPEELDGGDRFWVTIGSTFGLRGESVAVTDSEDEFTGDEGESKGADGTALGVVVEELAPEDPALPGNIQSPNNGVPEAAAVYVPAQRVVSCIMLCARAAVPTPNMKPPCVRQRTGIAHAGPTQGASKPTGRLPGRIGISHAFRRVQCVGKLTPRPHAAIDGTF